MSSGIMFERSDSVVPAIMGEIGRPPIMNGIQERAAFPQASIKIVSG